VGRRAAPGIGQAPTGGPLRGPGIALTAADLDPRHHCCDCRLDDRGVQVGHLVAGNLRVREPPVGQGFARPDDRMRDCFPDWGRELAFPGRASLHHAADRIGDLSAQSGHALGQRPVGGDLAEQHLPAVAVLLDEGQELRHPDLQPDQRRVMLPDCAQQPLQQLPPGAVDVGDVELLLGAEVGVHHRFRDPGELGDLVHRGGVIAVARESLAGDVENQPLALRTWHPARACPVRPARIAFCGGLGADRRTPGLDKQVKWILLFSRCPKKAPPQTFTRSSAGSSRRSDPCPRRC
jgi:hypothetical protein